MRLRPLHQEPPDPGPERTADAVAKVEGQIFAQFCIGQSFAAAGNLLFCGLKFKFCS